MTSVLFIWILSQGAMSAPVTETFYTLEACQTAARKAENVLPLFSDIKSSPDIQVRAYCSTKRLSKEPQQ
jgi:hypothetical protein